MKKIFTIFVILGLLILYTNVEVSADEIVSDEYKIINYDGQQNFSYFIDQNNTLYASGTISSALTSTLVYKINKPKITKIINIFFIIDYQCILVIGKLIHLL